MRARKDFMGDRAAMKLAYGMDGWNKDNFYMGTKAIWDECEMPSGAPDYVSNSGSKYWYSNDGVTRCSDHWGNDVGTCEWSISDDYDSFGSSWKYDSGETCAFCAWEKFDWINYQPTLNIEPNVDEIPITPSMLRDGYVYWNGYEIPYGDGYLGDVYVDESKLHIYEAAMKLSYYPSSDVGWEKYPGEEWWMRDYYLTDAYALILAPGATSNDSNKYLLRFQLHDNGQYEEYLGDTLEELQAVADEMNEEHFLSGTE